MGSLHLEFQATDAADSRRLDHLLIFLQALNAAIPLASFEWTRKAAPNTTLYDYEIVTADARTWKSEIEVPADGSEASMTFSVPQRWKLSEFLPHRALRDHVIAMARLDGLSGVEATWT